MPLDRVTVWKAGEVLTAAALNAEVNNILNNAMALITPLVLQNLGVSPGATEAGRIYYNSVTKQIELDDGTFIRVIPSVLSTEIDVGDVIVASTGGSFNVIDSAEGANNAFSYAQNNTGAGLMPVPVL